MKYYQKISLLFVSFTAGVLVSCGDKENVVIFTQAEVIRLLSGDSVKAWLRMDVTIDGTPNNLSECDLFTSTRYISRNDSLIYMVESLADFCDGTSAALDSGYCKLYEESVISDRIDRIAYFSVRGDSTGKQLIEITSLYLILQENKESSVYTESFEYSFPD